MVERQGNGHQGRVICAWCDRDMGPSGSSKDLYSTCPECWRLLQERYRQELEEKLRQRKR